MSPEQRLEGLLREVRAEMGRQDVNITRLSERVAQIAPISQASLSRKLRGETPLTLVEALVICEALHVTIPTLLQRADEMAAA